MFPPVSPHPQNLDRVQERTKQQTTEKKRKLDLLCMGSFVIKFNSLYRSVTQGDLMVVSPVEQLIIHI